MPPLRTDLSDGALIERTRRGDRAAYGELWQRHAPSARTVARSFSSLDPDDLVAESFTRIYDAILAGRGPTGAFRPYLFTTVRNTAASWGRSRHETTLDTLESFEDPATSESATLDALDRSTTAQAFRSLPTRWQEVLWYTEVEGMQPAQVAPLVGMSANATAALAYRAREGLRQAWIQAHLRNAEEPECRWTIDRLGGYTRGRLRTRDTARLEAHLDDCARCTIVAAEAREVGSRLALVLLPLAAGVGGATAYSAWLSQGAPVAHVALGAAGLPPVLVGHVAAGSGAGSAAGAGSAGAGAGAGAASTGSAGGASAGAATAAAAGTTGANGVAIGAGIGAVALAAAAVTAAVVLPSLATADQAPAAIVAQAEPDSDAPPIELPGGPVPPTPLPAPPGIPDAPATGDADGEGTDVAPPAAPTSPSVPGPTPAPGPTPTPTPTPTPEPEPVDDTAAAPAFTADTAGGLVDPLLSGTAEPGAAVTVTSGDGRTWSTTAGASGTWSVVADALPAGATELTAAQVDVAGNASAASDPVVVELSSPSLELRPSGPIVWHLTFGGAASADVQVLVDGAPAATVTLDGNGSVRYIGFGFITAESLVEVRYAVDARTGPVSTATLERG
ncbi:sigma-70 family RNA polymerase sigma factor [Agromyces mariniharenae]|uniref:sigma-70 family RNA polymerase sigma factor n=1 Tax=Agromyces mariniharenae TaxID=2604423 RepID=UPI001653290C|nr:sigma-70 family RNA polymerase sigma factor [Agromyces mariniharenae]